MVSEGAGINIRHIQRHPGTVLASGGRTEKADMQSETSLNNSAVASVAAEVAEARNWVPFKEDVLSYHNAIIGVYSK